MVVRIIHLLFIRSLGARCIVNIVMILVILELRSFQCSLELFLLRCGQQFGNNAQLEVSTLSQTFFQPLF